MNCPKSTPAGPVGPRPAAQGSLLPASPTDSPCYLTIRTAEDVAVPIGELTRLEAWVLRRQAEAQGLELHRWLATLMCTALAADAEDPPPARGEAPETLEMELPAEVQEAALRAFLERPGMYASEGFARLLVDAVSFAAVPGDLPRGQDGSAERRAPEDVARALYDGMCQHHERLAL